MEQIPALIDAIFHLCETIKEVPREHADRAKTAQNEDGQPKVRVVQEIQVQNVETIDANPQEIASLVEQVATVPDVQIVELIQEQCVAPELVVVEHATPEERPPRKHTRRMRTRSSRSAPS